MKEKTRGKLYFTIFLLFLFLIIFIFYHSFQEKKILDSYAEDSYQKIISEAKIWMLTEYSSGYLASTIDLRENFDKYWEDAQKYWEDEKNKDSKFFTIFELEIKYKVEYIRRFESDYMKDLIYENITFGQAVEEFEESEEFRILEIEYKTRIKNELSDLGFTKQWFKIAGLKAGKFAVSLIPTTTKSLVLTIGLIFGFYFLLRRVYHLFVPKSISKNIKK